MKYAQICSKHALKLKNTIFDNIQKRPNNGQTILFLANNFKKGQMATLITTGGAEEPFLIKLDVILVTKIVLQSTSIP